MSFYKRFNILNIEIYTFIGGMGVKGSLEGLYTFLEVAEIYGIDDSCLRKQVARGKFVIGEGSNFMDISSGNNFRDNYWTYSRSY